MLNCKNSARLTVDGNFGQLTEIAVKNWQSKNGLAVDGIVGPNTWTTLCGTTVTPTCSVINSNPAYGNTGKQFNPRAQFILDILKACFPGKFTGTTYMGHESYGNSIDIWPVGGGYGIKATGTLKTNMDTLASWLMKNSSSLKVSYMIFYNRIWNPARDAVGVWADCSTSGRCICASQGTCQDVTQGHYDHLHLTVL